MQPYPNDESMVGVACRSVKSAGVVFGVGVILRLGSG